jgi:hypothetical protein
MDEWTVRRPIYIGNSTLDVTEGVKKLWNYIFAHMNI